MCLATLQQERDEALAEFKNITADLRKTTHKKGRELEKEYEEKIRLILQIERDIKLVLQVL